MKESILTIRGENKISDNLSKACIQTDRFEQNHDVLNVLALSILLDQYRFELTLIIPMNEI